MRTVFVNPTVYSRGVKRGYSVRGKRRRKGKRRRGKRKNPYILNPRRRRNPGFGDMGGLMRDTATIAAGAAGGAILNRVGINNISNFYMRNGLRVAAAAFLSTVNTNPALAIAAAGAVLAPVVPEVETQMAAMSLTKNPSELAADLADLLEADLSDDEVSDDEISDDEVSDDEVSW